MSSPPVNHCIRLGKQPKREFSKRSALGFYATFKIFLVIKRAENETVIVYFQKLYFVIKDS